MSINNISIVIIAKDAEATIEKCLKSLADFKEVILYLNNTTDATKEIAKEFKNVIVVNGEFLGFGETKNKAATFSSSDWILSLDSDEVLTKEFVKHLSSLELKDDTVYSIVRRNHYKDIEIKHCWGDDIIPRLYNKKITSFNSKKVHEKIVTQNLKEEVLPDIVAHYPYSSISDFIVKLDRYSTIFAQDNVGKKGSSPEKAFFNGIFSFFKTYILKRGFLDGYAGLVIAFSHMATNFYKYIKLYEANKELNK